jgi:hypothetical protein
MAQVTGVISEEGKVLFKGIAIDLWPGISPSIFRGEFVFPEDGPHLAIGKLCDLTLADGRSGQILIRRVIYGSKRPTRVEFITTGPFC